MVGLVFNYKHDVFCFGKFWQTKRTKCRRDSRSETFAQQEYLKLLPIASNLVGAEYVATQISNSVCLTPDGKSAWAWGEITLLLESLDREQLRSFGTLWLAPNGTRAGFHTDRLVEVLANCYTVVQNKSVAPAMNAEVGKSKPIELQVPLIENDRNLLVAMLQAKSSKVRPTTGEELMKLAIGSGDKNKAFKRLKENGLVVGKGSKGGGYWLTETGSIIAKDLTINH